MFRRRTKSALLIDFDNIVGATNGDFGRKIPNWMDWLEDGRFENGRRKRRRSFVVKRVYWHEQNNGYRPAFEDNGFEAITCKSVIDRKSTADMIIALDALEATYEQDEIQEYFVLTTDTDFVPLMEKLGNRSRRTVSAGNPTNLSYDVFRDHADIVIGTDALKNAFTYQRPTSLLNRFREKWRQRREQIAKRKAEREAKRLEEARRKAAEAERIAAQRAAPERQKAQLQKGKGLLETAAEHIARIGARSPGLAIGRTTITRTLKNHMPEFSTTGPSPYLGCGSYNQMLERITKLGPDLRLHRYGRRGRGISYRSPS